MVLHWAYQNIILLILLLISLTCYNGALSLQDRILSDDKDLYIRSVTSGLLSTTMVNLYRKEHGRDVLLHERSSSKEICSRKFIIGTYSCPMQVGNRLHEFLNTFAAAIILNRTLVYRFCDRDYCKSQSQENCDKMLKILDWIPSFDEVNEFASKRKCPLLAESSSSGASKLKFENWQNFVVPSKKRDLSLFILQCCNLDKINDRVIQLGVLERHELVSLTWNTASRVRGGNSHSKSSIRDGNDSGFADLYQSGTFRQLFSHDIKFRADILFNDLLTGEYIVYGLLFYNAFQFEETIIQIFIESFNSLTIQMNDGKSLKDSSFYKMAIRDFTLPKSVTDVSQYPDIKSFADKLFNDWLTMKKPKFINKKGGSSKILIEPDSYLSIWNSLYNYIYDFLYGVGVKVPSNSRKIPPLRVGVHIRHPNIKDEGGLDLGEENCILKVVSDYIETHFKASNIDADSISASDFSCEIIIASDREKTINNLINYFCNSRLLDLTNKYKLGQCRCISRSNHIRNNSSNIDKNILQQSSSASSNRFNFHKLINTDRSSPALSSEHGLSGDSILAVFDVFLLSQSDAFIGGSDNMGMLSTYSMLAASLSRYRKDHIVHHLTALYLEYLFRSMPKNLFYLNAEVLISRLVEQNKQILLSANPLAASKSGSNSTIEDSKLFWLPTCGTSRGSFAIVGPDNSVHKRESSTEDASWSIRNHPLTGHSLRSRANIHNILYKIFEAGKVPFDCVHSNFSSKMPPLC